MAVSYEAQVIQSFADKLYRQAARIVFTYAIRGVLIGGVTGYSAGLAARMGSPIILALVFAAVAAGIGASMAQGKADALRLQAQTALCQVQIETNTKLSAQAAVEAYKRVAA